MPLGRKQANLCAAMISVTAHGLSGILTELSFRTDRRCCLNKAFFTCQLPLREAFSTVKKKAAEWPVHQNKESSVNNDPILPSIQQHHRNYGSSILSKASQTSFHTSS
jgi:hypothetical protein